MRDDYFNNQDRQIEQLEIIGTGIGALAEKSGELGKTLRDELFSQVREVRSEIAEHRRMLEGRLDRVHERFDGIDRRVDGVEANLGRTQEGLGNLAGRVGETLAEFGERLTALEESGQGEEPDEGATCRLAMADLFDFWDEILITEQHDSKEELGKVFEAKGKSGEAWNTAQSILAGKGLAADDLLGRMRNIHAALGDIQEDNYFRTAAHILLKMRREASSFCSDHGGGGNGVGMGQGGQSGHRAPGRSRRRR